MAEVDNTVVVELTGERPESEEGHEKVHLDRSKSVCGVLDNESEKEKAIKRWSSVKAVLHKSSAISDDTKRIMIAFHALDDLTVLPENLSEKWSYQNSKSSLLIVALPSLMAAAWMAIPLNPWNETTWGEKQISVYMAFSIIYTFFLGLNISQFFNAVMPLSKLHQFLLAIIVSVTVVIAAYIAGAVRGKYSFSNCVVAAVAWGGFGCIGIALAFGTIGYKFRTMMEKAKNEVDRVVENARSYRDLYIHTTQNINKGTHVEVHLSDVASAVYRSFHGSIMRHHHKQVQSRADEDAKIQERAQNFVNDEGEKNTFMQIDPQSTGQRYVDKGESHENMVQNTFASIAENDYIEDLNAAMRFEIAEELGHISSGFRQKKWWQFCMCMLVIFICMLTYWGLIIFVAWWASGSHDPILKGWQTIVYYVFIFVMEWLAMLCADMIDVAQITTATPGALTAELHRKFDDFQFYRLSTRVMFYFSCIRRAFYIPLFIQIDNWDEWVSMTIASMGVSILLQMLIRSTKYYTFMVWYVGKCWPNIPYRKYTTCLDQSCLYNFYDSLNLLVCVFQFMVCQGLISSQNANSFPYFSKASKDLLLFVIVWALFQAFYCGFIIFYESRMYNRVAHITLEHIYNTGDTILFSMVVMAISVTQHPYFALSLNNLSTEACHGIYDGTPHALNLTTNVTARM